MRGVVNNAAAEAEGRWLHHSTQQRPGVSTLAPGTRPAQDSVTLLRFAKMDTVTLVSSVLSKLPKLLSDRMAMAV